LALPDPPLRGRAFRRELARLERSRAADDWHVRDADLAPVVGGMCDHAHRTITVAATLEPDARLRVLVHQAADAEGVLATPHGRAAAECIVEAASFIVCARAGLDVAAASVPYVAGWQDEGAGVLERDAAAVNRVTQAAARDGHHGYRVASSGRLS